MSMPKRREMILFGRRKSVLPNRRLIGGSLFLIVLVVALVIADQARWHAKGVAVKLSLPAVVPSARTITIRIGKDHSTKFFLDGKPVRAEDLVGNLHQKLDAQPMRIACVDADPEVRYQDVLYAMDAASAVGAQVVILPSQMRIPRSARDDK